MDFHQTNSTMGKWLAKLVLFVCIRTFVKCQSNHIIKLYDGTSGIGSSVVIDNYVDNLNKIGFNDVTTSLCIVQGM